MNTGILHALHEARDESRHRDNPIPATPEHGAS